MCKAIQTLHITEKRRKMKAEINQQTVADAAHAITKRGAKVTAVSVRTELGGGSYSTINPLINLWRDRQKERDQLAEVDVPDEIALHGEELIARVWRMAVTQASETHDVLRRELATIRAEGEAEQDEIISQLSAVESERDQVIVDMSGLRVSLTDAQTVADKLQAELAEARVNLATMVERVDQYIDRVAAAETRADKAEARADKAEERADKAEARADLSRPATSSL